MRRIVLIMALLAACSMGSGTRQGTPTSPETEAPAKNTPAAVTPRSFGASDAATATPGDTVEGRLIEAYEEVEGVASVGLVYASELDDGWLVSLEIMVEPGANTQATADALRQATYEGLVSAAVEFSAILDDGVTARDYVWSNVTDDWTVTELTMVTRQPTETSFMCSSSCDGSAALVILVGRVSKD